MPVLGAVLRRVVGSHGTGVPVAHGADVAVASAQQALRTRCGLGRHRRVHIVGGVGAVVGFVAGALGAIVIQFVAPDSFTFVLAIGLFVGLVVGGIAILRRPEAY